MVVVSNRQILIQSEFGPARFRKSLQFNWLTLNVSEPVMHQLAVHGSVFIADDSYLMLPPAVDEFFNLQQGEGDPIDEKGILGGAIVEMHPDQEIVTRNVYNVTDLIGDIGGIVTALQIIFRFLFWLFFGDQLRDYLIHTLYKTPTKLVSKNE